MERAAHWQRVWRERAPEAMSWYEPAATTSLDLIRHVAPDRNTAVIDVGGGASRLVDGLLNAGYSDVTVLDIAPEALAISRRRLAGDAKRVHWAAGDVLDFRPRRRYGLWHDRAVFHFLVAPAQRRSYLEVVDAALDPAGACVIATFAPEGPEQCSGLPVQRYDGAKLATAFGDGFELLEACYRPHRTPAGATQAFGWFVLRRRS